MEAAQIITDIWLQDANLGDALASLSWLADGVNEDELQAFRFLYRIAETDIDLANTAVTFPWLADNVTEDEWETIWALSEVAFADPQLARTATTLPWLTEGVIKSESSTLFALGDIASEDINLARTAITLPWLTDGVTPNEANELLALHRIASTDLSLARTMLTLPRIVDGMTVKEGSVFQDLAWVASVDLQLANKVLTLPWVESHWDRDLIHYFLNSLGRIASREADTFSQLTTQPWFADGLNEEEAALVVTLSSTDYHDPALYRDLFEAHYTQTRTVSLPLAGEMNIWVIQPTPFPQDEDLLTVIEDAARIMEGFLGVPFPTTDIILLVADESYRIADLGINVGGYFARTHMRLTRYDGREVEVPSIPHETAHYYFGGVIQAPR